MHRNVLDAPQLQSPAANSLSKWSQMPAHVLTSIFALAGKDALLPSMNDTYRFGTLNVMSHTWNCKTTMEAYQRYHKLRLVCKRFHETCGTNPELSSKILLLEHLRSKSVSSLIKWMLRHKSLAFTLLSQSNSSQSDKGSARADPVDDLDGSQMPVRCCNASLERLRQETVQAAVHDMPKLKTAILYSPSLTSVKMLASFHELAYCTLDCRYTKGIGSIDLTELRLLPKLTSLQLEGGRFRNVSRLANLTSLDIVHAYAECDEKSFFQYQLKKLCFLNCLYNSSEVDMLGFTNLESLTMQDTPVGRCTSDAMPSSLSALTKLTHLVITVASERLSGCVGWLYELTNLQALHLWTHREQLTISDHICALSNLEILLLAVDGMLTLDCAWLPHQSLRLVTLQFEVLLCGEQFLELSRLPKLFAVHIIGGRPLGDGTALLSKALLSDVHKHCPDVYCWLAGKSLYEFLD